MDPSNGMSISKYMVLATSSALTAVFYSFYRNSATTANRLRSAKKVSIDQDLKQILAEIPGRCVPYAVVEGVVKAVNKPLNSQFVDNCKGVYKCLTVHEKVIVWDRTNYLWNGREDMLTEYNKNVPFAIGSLDENVSSVQVISPDKADEVKLETTYQNFHFTCGGRPKGILETEQMLLVGENLTGIGKLVLDNDVVKLQPAKDGYCYILSRMDYKTLLNKQEVCVQGWKDITILFGVASCLTWVNVMWKNR